MKVDDLSLEAQQLLRDIHEAAYDPSGLNRPVGGPKRARWICLDSDHEGDTTHLERLGWFQVRRRTLQDAGHPQYWRAAWREMKPLLTRLKRSGWVEIEKLHHTYRGHICWWVRLSADRLKDIRASGILIPTSHRGVPRTLWHRLRALGHGTREMRASFPKAWEGLVKKGLVELARVEDPLYRPSKMTVVRITPAGRLLVEEIREKCDGWWGASGHG